MFRLYEIIVKITYLCKARFLRFVFVNSLEEYVVGFLNSINNS